VFFFPPCQECEAICSRIGIMVSGRLKCLGSSQHLKHKFGASYEVNIRCREEESSSCLHELRAALGSGELEEQHRTSFRLRLGHCVDLSAAFRSLESLKAAGRIWEYNLSQSSLEQIFINFARQQQQRDDDDHQTTAAAAVTGGGSGAGGGGGGGMNEGE